MEKSVIIRVKVHTNKSATKLNRIGADGTLQIDIKAKPINGKANNELIRFLAKRIGINKNKVEIISGKSSSLKLVRIESFYENIFQKMRDDMD